MKNINYIIGAKFNNTFGKISNKIFDCVRSSIVDKYFNIKEDIIDQVLDSLRHQIYEKY